MHCKKLLRKALFKKLARASYGSLLLIKTVARNSIFYRVVYGIARQLGQGTSGLAYLIQLVFYILKNQVVVSSLGQLLVISYFIAWLNITVCQARLKMIPDIHTVWI